LILWLSPTPESVNPHPVSGDYLAGRCCKISETVEETLRRERASQRDVRQPFSMMTLFTE
jgi:hypothetical protein